MLARETGGPRPATAHRRLSLKRLGVLSALGVAVACVSWLDRDGVQARQALPNQRTVYSYAVKIVCATDGTIDFRGGGPTLGDTDTVLVDADLYQTAVNVFNPGRPTELHASLAVSHEPHGSRRTVFVDEVPIQEYDAIEFDCDDFANAVHGDRYPGGTGFFTFWSEAEVDVVAVYSMIEKTRCDRGVRTVLPGRAPGTGCHGAGASLDIEYIRPRVVQLPN